MLSCDYIVNSPQNWGNIIPVSEIYYLIQQISCFGHWQTKLVRNMFVVSLLSYTLTRTKLSTNILIETIHSSVANMSWPYKILAKPMEKYFIIHLLLVVNVVLCKHYIIKIYNKLKYTKMCSHFPPESQLPDV